MTKRSPRSRTAFPVVLALLLVSQPWRAGAAGPASKAASTEKTSVKVVFVPNHYFEYRGDGTGLIGLVTSAPNSAGYVDFTDCSNKTTSVEYSKLRESKAHCPAKKDSDGPWTIASNRIQPVFLESPEQGGTNVIVGLSTVDLGPYLKWSGAHLPEASASAPIGYVFKDIAGKPSIAIMATNTNKIEMKSIPGLLVGF